jgi:SOS-response transcriptional repressor LexA
MLTPRQRELLIFIKGYMDDHGYAPTLSRMAHELNLASKSSAFRLLAAMEKRGFIRRMPHRERAIEILQMPTDVVDPTDARQALHELVSTYRQGRFPTSLQWQAAAAVLGNRQPPRQKSRRIGKFSRKQDDT